MNSMRLLSGQAIAGELVVKAKRAGGVGSELGLIAKRGKPCSAVLTVKAKRAVGRSRSAWRSTCVRPGQEEPVSAASCRYNSREEPTVAHRPQSRGRRVSL